MAVSITTFFLNFLPFVYKIKDLSLKVRQLQLQFNTDARKFHLILDDQSLYPPLDYAYQEITELSIYLNYWYFIFGFAISQFPIFFPVSANVLYIRSIVSWKREYIIRKKNLPYPIFFPTNMHTSKQKYVNRSLLSIQSSGIRTLVKTKYLFCSNERTQIRACYLDFEY